MTQILHLKPILRRYASSVTDIPYHYITGPAIFYDILFMNKIWKWEYMSKGNGKKPKKKAVLTEEITVLVTPEDLADLDMIAEAEDRSRAYIVRKLIKSNIDLETYKKKIQKGWD